MTATKPESRVLWTVTRHSVSLEWVPGLRYSPTSLWDKDPDQMTVTRLLIQYNRDGAGPWFMFEAKVGGIRLRKNGEPGLAERSVSYLHNDNLPGWLAEAVAEHTPGEGS